MFGTSAAAAGAGGADTSEPGAVEGACGGSSILFDGAPEALDNVNTCVRM